MRFLCDVHISYKIADHLNSLGFETIHINNILYKWKTKDKKICEYADSNDLIVIMMYCQNQPYMILRKRLRKSALTFPSHFLNVPV